MTWWNKYKKVLFLIIALLFVLTVAIAISISMFRPPELAQVCTLVGCGGGINIELAELPVDVSYQVTLSLPSGESETLSCGGVQDNSNPFEKSCSSNGAFFSLDPDVSAPDQITVTVLVAEKQTSQVFRPVYEKNQPNGEDCPPICYSATVKMSIEK